MYRILALLGLLSLLITSCEKLGEDYPFEERNSIYSEAYEVSITLEPLNQAGLTGQEPVFANLQNGTSYGIYSSWGKGYDLHIGVLDSTTHLVLSSISNISRFYSDPNLWYASDNSTAQINFYDIGISKANDSLYTAFRDENSLYYIITRQGMLGRLQSETIKIDTSDTTRYVYFASETQGSSSKSKNIRGILKMQAVTRNADFDKVHIVGKVIYKY